jgi:hypothetical protein
MGFPKNPGLLNSKRWSLASSKKGGRFFGAMLSTIFKRNGSRFELRKSDKIKTLSGFQIRADLQAL